MIETLKRWLPWIKTALGVALLLVVFLQVDWPALAGYLKVVRPGWMTLGLAAVLAGLLVKVGRWGLLLRHFSVRVPASVLWEAYLSGQAMNVLLPARGGEFVRLGVVSADQPKDSPEVVSSIVMEKSLDVVALAGLVSFLLLALPGEKGAALEGTLPRLALLILGLMALLIGLFKVWPKIYAYLATRLEGRPLSALQALHRVASIWLDWVRHPGKMLSVMVITLLNWIIMWATNLIIFRALDVPAGAVAAALVLALIMIGLLPAWTPGNMGPFYFFATLGLKPFDVPLELGMAFAVVLHAVVTLPVLILGGIILLLPRLRTIQAKPSKSAWTPPKQDL